MTQPIEYVTIVEPVLEVTLIGTADRAVWAPHFDLGARTADPVTVVLSAVETIYMGVRFRELSLSLLLDDAKGILVHAFNSSRVFAFIERQMFHTPYYYAAISVTARHIHLATQGQPLLDARLPDTAPVERSADECREWQLTLPTTKPQYFYARLEGHTEYYACAGSTVQGFDHPAMPPAFTYLQQSNFRLHTWSVRTTARHSKSKTYSRRK